jgi:hypothetical protein
MTLSRTASRLAAAAGLGVVIAGCSSAALATTSPSTSSTPTATVTPAGRALVHAARSHSRIDKLTAQAQRRYGEEIHGRAAHVALRRVAADPGLRRAIASDRPSTVRAYVRRQFRPVWYHWHVSAVRIVRGSQVLAQAGVPFAVAPSQTTLRDVHGRVVGTLQISIQDEIGFVRYMHRNFGVDIVVRGRAAQHVRTSLPAAATRPLPARGTVTIGGRRMAVRSFHATALGGEPVTVWVLTAG